MIQTVIETVYTFLWGDLVRIPLPGGSSLGLSLLVLLLVPAGVYFTVRTRFLPFRLFPEMLRVTLENNKRPGGEGHISGVQALIVSTACRVGMGNLVGVVAAISAGGAGAVFWMWVMALLGSSTAFIEATLAQLYKEKDPLYGGYRGGPAYYLHHLFAKKGRRSVLACLFALSGLVCWCGISQVTANSISSAFENAFGVPPLWSTVALVALAAVIVLRKHATVKVLDLMVPVMAACYFFLTLFIIVTVVFCLLRLMPVEGYFSNFEKMTQSQIQAGLQSMGLLDPLPVQILRFWKNALQGDLGVSHIYRINTPVVEILAQKLPISIQMGVAAMLLSLAAGLPMGLLMGRFKGRWPDKVGTALIVLIQAVPAAVYYLYIQMYGTTLLGVGLLFDETNWRYWVLPVCSMSLANTAFYAMWLRRYMVDESNKDYVRLARAKGESESRIALGHLFRNAMVPLVQYIPSAFLNTVVGSIYIESLYSIPGMGGLLVTCVQRHDNTMVQGIVLLYACVGILGLILGDLLMVLIDPRITLSRKEEVR